MTRDPIYGLEQARSGRGRRDQAAMGKSSPIGGWEWGWTARIATSGPQLFGWDWMAAVPLLSMSRPSPTRPDGRLQREKAWSLWGRSAWRVRFWRCPGRRGFQPDSAEDAAADRAGAHFLLQPGHRRCGGRGLGIAQGLPGLVQEAPRLGRGIEAGVADFPKSWWEHVLDQAVEELHGFQGGGTAMLGVEGHLLIRFRYQPGVGHAHPVRIAAEILVMWCTT